MNINNRLNMKNILLLTALLAAWLTPALACTSAVADELSDANVNDWVASLKTNRPGTAFVAAEDTLPPGKARVPREVTNGPDGSPAFEVVEQMPEYSNGGMEGLMRYFKEGFVYPVELDGMALVGHIAVRFVVREDGSISDARVLHGVHPLLDAEALRLVNAMPKWKPGMQDGKPVAVRYTAPVVWQHSRNYKYSSAYVRLVISDTASYSKDLLILVDGKDVSPEILRTLNPDRIQTVYVLNEPSAVARYTTDKSKRGVMLVTLKK